MTGSITRRKFMEGLAAVILGVTLTPQKVFASLDEITQEEISRYMSMNTVEEILGNSVRYITPGEWDTVIKENKKDGVLVLVYNKNNVDYSKRLALIFKNLAEHYSSGIEFIAVQTDEIEKHGLKAIPSIAMYSRFDLLKSEKPENNDGIMKKIDILRSGPKKNSVINEWYKFFSSEWLPTNITAINGKYCWRFNNTWNEQQNFYSLR